MYTTSIPQNTRRREWSDLAARWECLAQSVYTSRTMRDNALEQAAECRRWAVLDEDDHAADEALAAEQQRDIQDQRALQYPY